VLIGKRATSETKKNKLETTRRGVVLPTMKSGASATGKGQNQTAEMPKAEKKRNGLNHQQFWSRRTTWNLKKLSQNLRPPRTRPGVLLYQPSRKILQPRQTSSNTHSCCLSVKKKSVSPRQAAPFNSAVPRTIGPNNRLEPWPAPRQ